MPKTSAVKIAEEQEKYGKATRLSLGSLETLAKFDKKPDVAIGMMHAALEEARAANNRLASEKFNAASVPKADWDKTQLKQIVKDAVTEELHRTLRLAREFDYV